MDSKKIEKVERQQEPLSRGLWLDSRRFGRNESQRREDKHDDHRHRELDYFDGILQPI
jgi:hypothetical protein